VGARWILIRVVAVLSVLGSPACKDAGAKTAATDAITVGLAVEHAPTHIDSILPIEEEVRRFRATVAERPDGLDSGATRDRDRLVSDFIERLERRDTAALASALLTKAEFAYLYYPYTRFTAPPSELPPALLWFQITQNGSTGLTRLLRTWAGRDLGYQGYDCAPEPRAEGPNRLWERCTVRLSGPDGAATTRRLFGTILERDGRFKFVSFANDL